MTEKSDQGKCCKRNLERTDVREQTSGENGSINVIRDRELKKQLRLRKERTSGRIFRETVELEFAKQIVGTSIRLRKMWDWTSWKVRSLPKRKKRLLAA
jgi:hypothetical protein